MRLSPTDLRNYSILGVFVAGAAFYAYTQLHVPDGPAVVPPPVVTTIPTVPATGAQKLAPSTAPLDPTLHMEAMLVTESLVYSGTGRNIFSATYEAPVATLKTIAAVRIPETIAPIRPVATGPAPPSPIDLKFFGTETSSTGGRRAFLLHGEDVFLVSSGDIVQRRYRVLSIDARSIQIEDIANSNRQTLPLLVN